MQILKVIQNHGYTLEQVATMLGITKGSLSATINGSPNVKKLIDIALKIGCSPSEFFDDWYENEGKDMANKPAEDKIGSAHDGGADGKRSPEAVQTATATVNALPFKDEPVLTADVALICPHCHEAIKMGFIK
jgi:transcriptional regulator with XRE-family HTH domain